MTDEISTPGDDDRIKQLERVIDDLWEDVRRLRRECDERRRSGNLPAITNQELATAVGVSSDSTIGYWFDRRRRTVPDQFPFMQLIKVLGGEEAVWRPRWHKAKDAHHELRRLRQPGRPKADHPPREQEKTGNGPVDPDPQPNDSHPEAHTNAPSPPQSALRSSRRRPSAKRLVVAGVAGLGLIAVIAFVVWSPDETPKQWFTKITGTADEQGQDIGTYGFTNPRTSERRGPGYMGGDTVAVVCQERHGRQVSDSTIGRTSTVWNKLSDENWISDLYTELPKVDGNIPPLGIPTCG